MSIFWERKIHKLPYVVFSAYVLLAVFIFGCDNEGQTHWDSELPYVTFIVLPSRGAPDTVFEFDALDSFSRSGTGLSFRWDWENDGVWDTEFSPDGYASHKYDSLGYKTIRLEARDEAGNSGKAKGEVFVTVASKEMVLIPAGEFTMGSPEGMGVYDEHPQHKVYVDGFFMGKYEVTTEQYVEFLNAIGRIDDNQGNIFVKLEISSIKIDNNQVYKSIKGWEDHPMVAVSWHGAKSYAEWAGARLPTEAEWEKAVRGEDGRIWPWGNFWEIGRCNSWDSGIQGTTHAGSFPSGVSPYGVEDMAGNVFEWISDWYQDDYYGVSPSRNPKGPDSGLFHVLRGGSWVEFDKNCRAAVRFGQPPNGMDADTGFRIAKDL